MKTANEGEFDVRKLAFSQKSRVFVVAVSLLPFSSSPSSSSSSSLTKLRSSSSRGTSEGGQMRAEKEGKERFSMRSNSLQARRVSLLLQLDLLRLFSLRSFPDSLVESNKRKSFSFFFFSSVFPPFFILFPRRLCFSLLLHLQRLSASLLSKPTTLPPASPGS